MECSAKALLCYNRLRSLAALATLSWCSARLPLALHFLRSLFAAPAFFFLLSNAIILFLLANSCWLSPQLSHNPPFSDSQSHLPTTPLPEIVYEDKEMILIPSPHIGVERMNSDEEMSNEEFQKTIEAFIAKQMKFRQKESPAGVLQTYSL